MKFFTSAFAVAAFLLTAVSAVTSPNPINAPMGGEVVKAGLPYTIKWTATSTGTITLKLRKGESGNLGAPVILATNIPNAGSFVWSVSATLAAGNDYAIEIDAADGTPNYTGLFSIESSVKSTSTAEVTTKASTSAPNTSIGAKTTEVGTQSSTATSAVNSETTAAASSTTVTTVTTFTTSTSMRSNHTTTTVPSHGNSSMSSFSKTPTSTGKATNTGKTSESPTTTSAKPTNTTGAAARISGAGALMAVAAAAAVFVL